MVANMVASNKVPSETVDSVSGSTYAHRPTHDASESTTTHPNICDHLDLLKSARNPVSSSAALVYCYNGINRELCSVGGVWGGEYTAAGTIIDDDQSTPHPERTTQFTS